MEKQRKENDLLRGIQDPDGLKARIGSKKTDTKKIGFREHLFSRIERFQKFREHKFSRIGK